MPKIGLPLKVGSAPKNRPAPRGTLDVIEEPSPVEDSDNSIVEEVLELIEMPKGGNALGSPRGWWRRNTVWTETVTT